MLRFVVLRNKFDEDTIPDCRRVVNRIKQELPNSEFYAEGNPEEICAKKLFNPNDNYDFVIVIGGDGTMIHSASQFNHTNTPPIFGIGKGNSHVLYNYRHNQIDKILPAFIEKAKNQTISTDKGIRLRMTVKKVQLRNASSKHRRRFWTIR